METPNTPRPANHLVWSIIAIILCWPFGIPAIINATKVNKAYEAGQLAEAEQHSKAAKKWSLVATILGGISYVIYIIWMIVAAAAVSSLDSMMY